MRRIVPAMTVAVMLFLTGGASLVHGQETCTFTQGFAELRGLVGEQKVGACLENEHHNLDNGNSEQRTTGGLLVWRKADNFTAFTDGGTTWINGPNGLQSRPNGERLAWEFDPVVAAAPPSPTPRPLPTLPATVPVAAEPVQAPRVLNDGGTIATPNYAAQAGAPNTAPPPPVTGNAPAASAVPPPTGTPTSVSAAASATGTGAVPPPPPPPANAAAASVPAPAAVTAPAAATTTAKTVTATPTKTPTPKPAVTAKFVERPDEVDTGNDARFEVETNAKKGTCSLTVTYRNTSETAMGGKTIDDGRCEWKFTLPTDVKTGKAKAIVTVSATEGTTTVEDTFEVKKGDTVYAGSVDLEVDPTEMPDGSVDPGKEIKVGVDTNLKRKGSCDLLMTWPSVGAVPSATQMPDDRGRCSWTVTVPANVPRNSSANLLVTVRKDGSTVRTLTKDFKISK